MITATQLAERMKAEILDFVAAGTIPVTVGNFARLHDYVDANCLGGTEEMWDAEHEGLGDDDAAHAAANERLCGVMNPAMDAVDAWIKAGGILNAVPAMLATKGA